ncbi:metallophosphoesterase family protein (plasmid) [Pedobacter sp. BS3]|uniref:purple acid phosphatase family protein n=1 Tax=Pedobacter sp. BS3 TaxID=2567937 RepID=UPI0011ED6060|nr:metallophosphoesterase family protein [Pedobacter sp. BS3]TZF86035.1 metallophosphoesterase family protein [Pedobacter sp. BS3]
MKETSLQRRKFLGLVSKAGLLSVCRFPLSRNTGEPAEDEHVFLTQPYLQNPCFDAMTIKWITNKPCYGWVEYGLDENLGQKAERIELGLVEANNRIHTIQLSNLKPGTTYHYKVLSKDFVKYDPYKIIYGKTIESKVYSFTTPAEHADSVSLLVLNDIHDRPASIPFLMNMNGNDPYDFVFFNGDMFNYQSDEQQIIDHMLTPCTDVFASVKPFMYIRGNHETRGKFARHLNDYFENIDQANYFSFTRGPVHFITLDTGEDKPDDTPVYAGMCAFDDYRRQQAAWLEKQLQSREYRKAPFRVVFMHIPPYHSGDWHGTMHCRELFAPLFNKHKVDLVICGHTHRWGVYEPDPAQHHFPIIIGGGPQEGKRTLIKLRADRHQLNLSMLADNGKEVGKYHLQAKR